MNVDITSTIPLHTGREMPVLGLGTWQLNHDTADAIQSALEMGYWLIDTSGDYGTQPGIGTGLKASGLARMDYYIVTKVEDTDDAYVAAQDNLEELGLDYADLILIHHPPKSGVGENLWQGLIQARQDGLTNDIGVSNYSIEQIQKLGEMSGEIPVVNQIEWTPFGHDMEMLEYCRQNQIIIQAYSPLTRGERLDDPTLERIAKAHGKTPAQVLIRWNLQLEIVPIIKASRIEHLQENIDVFDFELTDQDMAGLNSLNELYSSVGRLAYAHWANK